MQLFLQVWNRDVEIPGGCHGAWLLWTAHAQLSQFYLDSTPHGRRELGPPGEYRGQRAWGRG